MTEFGFIASIKTLFAPLPDNGFEGIGDDCSVLSVGGGESLVFTADLLTEGVHFLRTATSPRELGRKSLAVNLRDVAAMGARPVATLLSIAHQADAANAWAAEFMLGYRELSVEFGVTLAGGDTTRSLSGLTINVSAIGRAADAHLKRRSDARPGDVIFTAGELGTSGAGLQDILAGRCDTPAAAVHRNPQPQVAEGIWLGSRPEVRAMMDLSDGLASDLKHILDRSGVGAEVAVEQIPAAPGADVRMAACSGEDYKLLLTAAPEAAAPAANNNYLFVPDAQPVLDNVLELYLNNTVYAVMLEARVGEHAARMTAMTAATDSTAELIEDLNLEFTRARQAALTTELSEIVGGSAALKKSDKSD